jgi:sucrose-6-phosphate hydrolase SacC (GH32 family)
MLNGQTMLETIACAEAAVRAAEPVAAADPHRPVFHFRPPAQWMNDICGALRHAGWYHKYLDANGTVLPRVLGDDPRRLTLHLFYDKSVMELFINDGLQTVTRVAIPPSPALHLEAAATGGAATLRALTAWPIKHSQENN